MITLASNNFMTALLRKCREQQKYTISDWRAPTIGQKIDYDIETFPLQLRTWADNDGSQLWLKFYGATTEELFTMSFKFNQFSLWLNPNCNSGYGQDGFFMKNVPEDSYKTWTIFKSSTEMKIECNGVEVWTKVYNSFSQGCHDAFTRDSSRFLFNEHSSAPPTTVFYRQAG